jgi:hypothetical protein
LIPERVLKFVDENVEESKLYVGLEAATWLTNGSRSRMGVQYAGIQCQPVLELLE